LPVNASHTGYFNSVEKIRDFCLQNRVDGLIYDLRKFANIPLGLDIPVIRYPEVIAQTTPCIAESYDLIGDMAVQMLIQPHAGHANYPLTLNIG